MYLPAEVCMCFYVNYVCRMILRLFSDYCAVLFFHKHGIAENEICGKKCDANNVKRIKSAIKPRTERRENETRTRFGRDHRACSGMAQVWHYSAMAHNHLRGRTAMTIIIVDSVRRPSPDFTQHAVTWKISIRTERCECQFISVVRAA